MEKWPIIPNRISLEDDMSINSKNLGVGIISKHQLKGILDEIANKIKCNIICTEEISEYNSIITQTNYHSEEDSIKEIPISIALSNSHQNESKVTNIQIESFIIDIDNIKIGEIKFLLIKESKIELLNESIVKIKQTLEKELLIKRKNFIYKSNEQLINSLRGHLKTLTTNKNISNFWNQIKKSLKEIIAIYPAEFLRIFATENIFLENPKVLKLVATSESNNVDQLHFNLESFKSKYNADQYITSIENNELLNYFYNVDKQITLDPGKELVRLIPSQFHVNGVLIIWIRYNDSWHRFLNKNDGIEKAFTESILSYYTFLSSNYLSFVSFKSLEQFQRTYKILGHEIKNLCTGLDGTRTRYIGSISQINKITPERLARFDNNLISLVKQISLMSRLSKEIVENKLVINKGLFYFYGQILFKWKDIYNEKCNYKKNSIIFPEELNEYLHPKIYADPQLLENMIYNLIENAYKYSYRGTNIYIDYYFDNFEQTHTISIINYSNKIYQDRRIYNIFERFDVDTGSKVEGLGIGLYICKKIAELHQGIIFHEVNKVSIYNVPLIKPFLENYPNRNQIVPKDVLESEVSRLNVNGYYKKVVALNEDFEQKYSSNYSKTFDLLLLKPTFEIKFVVKIK